MGSINARAQNLGELNFIIETSETANHFKRS